MSKDVILTPEQIAAEERRWLFDAPIAELAEVKGVTVDEAVKLRTDAILQEPLFPSKLRFARLSPKQAHRLASVNYGGVVIDDFKVVDGKNGIFLGAPSKPDPTSRTGYRSTVRVNDRATQERLNAAGARRTIQRWKSSSPGPRQSAHPDQGADGTGRKGGREGKCRPNRPGKEKGGPG